eukprot:TRINITY_DN3976_c4_g1_i3.p1 TRINITY_DN3976_c4_g1~~TRINITY_DN3976_c4_g1_i3.p1  ORF type:complete len:510 (+),score=90.35 TRINITY_DN3976_c4_g1_i3:40-1569(+)
MDVTLEDLLKKSGLAFDKIKGSTKRADVLETLAKRAGVEVDVVLIAMWETQWDDMVVAEEGGESPTSPEKEVKPEAPPEPKEEKDEVSFTDPVKGSVIKFMPLQDCATGLCYSVNGDPRPAITRIKLSIHTRGPRLDFPELKTAATIPWEGSQQIIVALKTLADTQRVEHNFPANGVLTKPEPRVQPQQPQPKVDITMSPQSGAGSPHPVRNPNLVTISAADGEFMSVRQGTVASLVSATYGDCYRVVDCSRSIPLNAGGFVIQVSSMTLGVPDFSPGSQKKLEVTYMPTMNAQQGTPQQNVMTGSQSTPQSMPHMSLSSQRLSVGPIVIEDDDGDEDPITERSTGSYRHDPYNPKSSRRDNNSVVDDLSEYSLVDDESMSRRTSDMSPEDLARYSSPTDRPGRAFVSTPSGESVYIPPGTISKVVRAVYGEGTLWVLATEAARNAVQDGGINGLVVSEESLGIEDPSPGKAKNLVIIYRPVPVQQPVATPTGYAQPYPSADEVSTQHI